MGLFTLRWPGRFVSAHLAYLITLQHQSVVSLVAIDAALPCQPGHVRMLLRAMVSLCTRDRRSSKALRLYSLPAQQLNMLQRAVTRCDHQDPVSSFSGSEGKTVNLSYETQKGVSFDFAWRGFATNHHIPAFRCSALGKITAFWIGNADCEDRSRSSWRAPPIFAIISETCVFGFESRASYEVGVFERKGRVSPPAL